MIVRKIRRQLGVAAMAVAFSLSIFAAPASADAGFQNWVREFRKTAAASGVSGATYDRAFRGITQPDRSVLEKARFQPEFRSESWDYFDNRVHDESVAIGRAMARKHKATLDRIEKRFGVSRNILLAIWSMESNYGESLKNEQALHNVVQALATLGYADKRRSKFARTQLVAALKILQRGDIDESHLIGSWAGAMGHTQFIPTSYQAYAVDMDGNGKRDIWNSVPDALATAANLLAKNGWRTGQTWGYEVKLPRGKLPSGSRTIAQWEALGVVRSNGRSFPAGSQSARLHTPDGRGGPAFLLIGNFNVIKRYNNADKYALAVGMLADQIAGSDGLVADWKRPFTKLSFEQRQELQKRLSQLGFYDGKYDGRIGRGSIAAIKAYQQRVGMDPDGHPSMEVLKQLRGG